MSQDAPQTVSELEARLSEPTQAVVDAMAALDGDLLILGAGGKMGPTLAKLARRAVNEAGTRTRVLAVSRFSRGPLQGELEQAGVETIAADLLADGAIESLPDVANVAFLVGMKFGTTGNEPLTWAMNVLLPGLVARRFRRSRLVTLSTGNVYPLTPVGSSGPTEEHPPAPVGEYAQSCLGRERVFEYASETYGTPTAILRLNYAIDLRYGVLLDVAQRVHARQPVDLRMGYANVIWQRDANAIVLRAFALCGSPATILNVTGPQTISIRDVAERFGRAFGVEPVFEGREAETALLSNAARCAEVFGPPAVSLDEMIAWVAHWVRIGGPTLNKPTHFEQRDGAF